LEKSHPQNRNLQETSPKNEKMSIKTSRKTSNPQGFKKTLNSTKNKPKFAGKPQGWQHWNIYTRDDRIVDFTIRSYPVFEK